MEIATHEVHGPAEDHRHQPQDGRDGRQYDRPETQCRRAKRRIHGRQTLTAFFVVGIDQHDIVVDHDPREREHADPAHDDAERLATHQQPEQHARGREQDGRQDQQGLAESIELGHHQTEHQQQRQRECEKQEITRLGLVFRFPAEAYTDVVGQVRRCELLLQPIHPFIHQQTRCDIGHDHVCPLPVAAFDQPRGRHGHEPGEIGQRHEAVSRRQIEIRQLLQVALLRGQPHADIDLFIRAFRSVGAEQQTIGQKLYALPDLRYVDTETCRLLPVEPDLQINPRQWQIVLDIDEPAHALHRRPDFTHSGRDRFRILAPHLDLDGSRGSGSTLLRPHLNAQSGHVGGPFTDPLNHPGRRLTGPP